MGRLRNLWSQTTLLVTQECNLNCIFCPLIQDNVQRGTQRHVTDIVGLMKDGRFFDVYKKKRLYNIVGGDALCFPDLLYILDFLKQHKPGIRLWTNGIFQEEHWDKVLPYLDHVMLYCPAPMSNVYRAITGLDAWSDFQITLNYLKEKEVSFSVNMPVKPFTIQYLQEVYDFTHAEQVPLVLHYSSNDVFSKDSIAYIKRFKSVEDVHVLKNRTRIQDTPVCTAYPFRLPFQGGFTGYGFISEWYSVLSNRYNLVRLFRRWMG